MTTDADAPTASRQSKAGTGPARATGTEATQASARPLPRTSAAPLERAARRDA